MAQPFRMLVTITSRLSVAVEFVFMHMFSKAGVLCPCCGGFVRVKPYVVGRKLARGLQVLYDAHGAEVHIDDFAGNSRMHGILCHAGLIEQLTHNPDKPFNRSGMWAITQRGRGLDRRACYDPAEDQRALQDVRRRFDRADHVRSSPGQSPRAYGSHGGRNSTNGTPMITKLDLQDPTCPRCSNIAMRPLNTEHAERAYWCAGCGAILSVIDTAEAFQVKAIYPTLVPVLPKPENKPADEMCSVCLRKGHTWRSHQRLQREDLALDAESLIILGTVVDWQASTVSLRPPKRELDNFSRDIETLVFVRPGAAQR